MTNLDFTDVELRQLITHHVGNKSREEKYLLSSEPTSIDEETKDFLIKYFLMPVKDEEFYAFTHTIRVEQNPMFGVAENIFLNPDLFIPNSQNIAKLLYESSLHPKIKEGELNIAFSSVR